MYILSISWHDVNRHCLGSALRLYAKEWNYNSLAVRILFPLLKNVRLTWMSTLKCPHLIESQVNIPVIAVFTKYDELVYAQYFNAYMMGVSISVNESQAQERAHASINRQSLGHTGVC